MKKWLILFLGIVLLTPWIDIAVSNWFYNSSTGTFSTHPFFEFFYRYGEYPAIITCLGAALIYLLSFVFTSWKPMRIPCLILILTLAIGAGLLINGVLKEQWGRPRPKQIEQFGGDATYRPFYKPDFSTNESHKSFPSGHAAMGFYFVTFSVLGISLEKRWLSVLGITLALALGTALSLTRIAQGGHFVSDILFSGLIMGATAYTLNWIYSR